MAEGFQLPRDEFLSAGYSHYEPRPRYSGSLYTTCQGEPWRPTERLMHHPVPMQPPPPTPPATPTIPRPMLGQHHHHHLGPVHVPPSGPPPHLQASPVLPQTPSPFIPRPSCQYEQYVPWSTVTPDTARLFPELSGLEASLRITPPTLLSTLAVGSDTAVVAEESKANCLKVASTLTPNEAMPPASDQAVPARDKAKPSPLSHGEPSTAAVPVNPLSQAEATCYIPNRTPNPGEYGFSAKFTEDRDAHTRGKIWTFSKELNLLLVQPNGDFPVTFSVDKPLPPNCRVKALTCFKHTSDIQRHGPVTRCMTHLERDKMLEHHEHFLVSKSAGATYSSQSSYNCVTVPVAENGSFAVYSCSCYSSCRFSGKPAPAMMIVFSLISVGEPHITLGTDVLNLRACATPSRDLPSLISKERRLRAEAAGQDHALADCSAPLPKRRRMKRPELIEVKPPLDCVEEEPDEDGYYTFTWRVKTKMLYNLLMMMKKGAELSNLS